MAGVGCRPSGESSSLSGLPARGGRSRIDEHNSWLMANPIVDLPHPCVLLRGRSVIRDDGPRDDPNTRLGRARVHRAELLGDVLEGPALIDVVDARDDHDGLRRGGHHVALEAATNLIAALPVHAAI